MAFSPTGLALDKLFVKPPAFAVRHFRPVDRPRVRDLVELLRDGLDADVLCGMSRPTLGRDALCHAFLAVDGARVLGGIWLVESLRCVELVDLLVDPAATLCGIGSALLREALLIADSHRLPIVAHVREGDLKGLEWLTSRGFLAVRLEREYFRECDAIVMQRSLMGKIRIAE
jgi:GNAT superfamily N-acetyltransferase